MRWFRVSLALAAAAAAVGAAAAPEQQFTAAIDQLASGERAAAERTLQELVANAPDFPLAQQFLDDLQTRLPKRSTAGALSELAEEGRIRLDSELAVPADGTIPDSVLQLAGGFRHVIAVDLPRARLYVLENREDGLHLVRSHYAAMGRQGWGKRTTGDLRTPIGVYHITGWIDGAELPPLYGAGAFPLDYPNFWDRYKQRTGHGIWLHGVPNETGTRAPRSSQGCVTMANADLRALQPYVEQGRTPVILSDALRWATPEAVQAERKLFDDRLEAWRAAAESGDADGYLTLYAAEFRARDGSNYDRFAEQRRNDPALLGGKFAIEELSVYRYPGAGDQLLLAEFDAVSETGGETQRQRRQLYWKLDGDGEWRIFRDELP